MNTKQHNVRERLAAINLYEGPFKTISDNVPMATRLRRINTVLAELGHTYHEGVPLDAMFDVLVKNGFQAVQEDNTPWDGIITGRDANYHIDLMDITGEGPTTDPNAFVKGKPARVRLNIQHYKMQSGRYEVNAYVN